MALPTITMTAFARTNINGNGGVGWMWAFDPTLFYFTQAATPANAPYTGILNVTSAKLFAIDALVDTIEHKFTQSMKAGSSAVQYDHTLDFELSASSIALTQYLATLDLAGGVDSFGVIFMARTGKIFVMGEMCTGTATTIPTPNPATIPYRWGIRQDGTTGGSGRLSGDQSGAKVSIKTSFSRNLIELTGVTLATLQGFE